MQIVDRAMFSAVALPSMLHLVAGTLLEEDPSIPPKFNERFIVPLLWSEDLHSWKVSVLAQKGLAFDLNTSTGKMSMAATSVMSGSSRPALRSSAKSAATRPSQVALPASADTVLPL